MRVIFTLHALRRMAYRNITEEKVREAVERPELIRKMNGKYHFQKQLKNGKIEVCAQKAETHIKIVTVYWL